MDDSTKIQVRVKVIGKWIKGVIFKKPMFSIEFIDGKFTANRKYDDVNVATMAEWNAYEIGKELLVTMYKHQDNGRWYYYPQN